MKETNQRFTFETKAENEYTLFRHDLIVNKEEKICFTTGNNLTFKFTDNNSINSHIYNYYVIVKNIYNDKEIYQTNKIKLLSY